MPAQVVGAVDTSGIALATSTRSTRLYMTTFADAANLAAGDEVPATNGNIAPQAQTGTSSLATHNAGTLQLANAPSYNHNFGMASPATDPKAAEILAAAFSDTDTSNEKKLPFNVILADGSKFEGVDFIGGAQANGEADGIFNYDIQANPIFLAFAAATA